MSSGSAERVAGNPFWRWAVRLAHRPDLPAIGYWSRTAAEAFYAESAAEFPNRATVLLRRTGRRSCREVKRSNV